MNNNSIRDVIIILKVHVDIGFTSSPKFVVYCYNWQMFCAIDTDEKLRGEGLSYKLTLPSWLIWEALEKHSGKKLQKLEEGIRNGALAWHAMPFTVHAEYMDKSLFEFGLSFSQQLDQRFGVKTIAAKMTDIPGYTRGMLPLLAQAGVKFLHVGVNPACPKPDVPELFIWRAPTGEEIMVLYSNHYGTNHQHPNIPVYLFFKIGGDNSQIPSFHDVRDTVANLKQEFPGANIRFGRLDDYAEALMPLWSSLPVVTSEIGDSWIHGVGTDPWKTKRYRALSNKRNEWLRTRKLLPESKAHVNFSKNLLLIAEHTWGAAHVAMLEDQKASMNNEIFDKVRHRGSYKVLEASWIEQRDYLENAVDALDGTKLHAEAGKIVYSTEEWPKKGSSTKSTDGRCGPFSFHVSTSRPGLASFKVAELTNELKSSQWPLFAPSYQSFSQADYDRYYQEYVAPRGTVESVPDFSKAGLEATGAVGKFWRPTLQSRRLSLGKSKSVLTEFLTFPEKACVQYGAPREMFVQMEFNAEGTIDITTGWRKKRATLRPEALWFHVGLSMPQPENWRISKLGVEIPFSDVVANGNPKLHATDRGIVWRNQKTELRLDLSDAALVSPGQPTLGIFDNVFESLQGGMHVLLWNNFWGTNFAAWYEEDATFHFRLLVTKTNKAT